MTESIDDNNETNYDESINDFPNTKDFFLKTSLYAKYKFLTTEQILNVEFYQDTIDTYCVSCARESVFKSDVKIPSVLINGSWHKPHTVELLRQANQINTESYDQRFLPVNDIQGHPQEIQDYAFAERFFAVNFHCTREYTHKLFYSFLVSQSHLIKIGQYPSLADLEATEIQKYRKVLSKEKYRELTRAIGLNASGVGVGAFVYLRRIFEDQLEDAKKVASNEPKWDEAQYESSRVDEKILILKKHLPEFLVSNRKIYGILSKGIHELSEDECKKYFNTVKLAIELILDEKLKKKEDEDKIKKVSIELENISSKLNATEK